ncbi:Breast cancer type 1 susceptibility protein-like [Holothuria leucospilota]|uniref:Breast cancer type 1 susceptibility protein-like n=1 Tax=Holothuria leucospilota TaxID=206669 RepID=A0A9Q0YSR2_HOLLE|nr:Breast cancer type 1 susceptibility protein-like [Holothuria leucospilota]
MASTSGIQKIHKTLTQMQKNLECSICLELLQDPVLTKCEHHFCNFCILALLQSKRRPSAPCPLCKEPITKRSLTTHSTLKSIVTAFQSVVAAIESDTGQKCEYSQGVGRRNNMHTFEQYLWMVLKHY